MPAYVVARMTVHDPELLREYARRAPPFVAKYGGRYLTRGGPLSCLEGTHCADRVVISVWPDTNAAKAFFADPEYREIAKLREAASTIQMLIVQDGIDYTDTPDPGV